MGLFNAPYMNFKHVVDVVSEYSKAKISKIFCLNSSSSFTTAWKAISHIHPLTLHKIQYCSHSGHCLDHLTDIISKY